jgi:hypothetical protein
MFVQDRIKKKGDLNYTSKIYGFPVMTNQETEIEFNKLKKINFKEYLIEIEYQDSHSYTSLMKKSTPMVKP